MKIKVEELTEEQYGRIAFQTALAKSILANQNALHHNEVLKGTEYYKADVKKYGKPFIMALMRAEVKEFEKVNKADTEFVYRNFENLDEVLKLLSKAIFCQWEELAIILKAHAKDPNSVLGISKKVMRKK